MRTKDDTKDYTGDAEVAEVARLTESLSKSLEPAIKRIKRINQFTENYNKSLEPTIKVISERINELAERVRETVRQLEIFKIEYEKEYNKIRTKFNAHFNKEGFVVDDADDFLLWLRCKNDSKSEVNLIEEAKKPSNYKLYHEYNLKCLYDDWDIIKELEYWEKQETELPKQQKEEAKKQKSNKIERTTLEQFFKDKKEYKKFIDRLAELGYIDPDTTAWIKEDGDYKSFIVAIIKTLDNNGKFDRNPIGKEIKNICYNTLKVTVSLSTIRHFRLEEYQYTKSLERVFKYQ